MKIQRALISVSDKNGLAAFGVRLGLNERSAAIGNQGVEDCIGGRQLGSNCKSALVERRVFQRAGGFEPLRYIERNHFFRRTITAIRAAVFPTMTGIHNHSSERFARVFDAGSSNGAARR